MKKWFLVLGLVGTLTMLNAQVISKNGIAKDNATGLMWQDDADAATINKDWEGAKQYCSNLTLGDKNDWRLPSVYELATLLDSTKITDPYVIDGFRNLSSYGYWSSTTSAYYADSAWVIGTGQGRADYYGKTNGIFVRCVRGGEFSFDTLSLLKKKGKLKVSQKEIDSFSPVAELKRKNYVEKDVQSKKSYSDLSSSWTVKSKFDNPKSYDPEQNTMVYNISCSNGNLEVISYFYNKPQGIQYFVTGKAGMATFDEAANYVCGNK